ncbi:MAG: hypothetical protein AB7E80_13875 [Hyphomicrobiaceae bacterium]
MRTCISLALLAATLHTAQAADGRYVVTSCANGTRLPIAFVADCSRLGSAATRALCATFIENQACRVYPTYRRLTGIDIAPRCRRIKCIIHDLSSAPGGRDFGGMAKGCEVAFMAKYAIDLRKDSPIGPHEVHELLHHFRMSSSALKPLTHGHALFGSSMAEAISQLGDHTTYAQDLKRLRTEADRIEKKLEAPPWPPAHSTRCRLARLVVESRVYLERPETIATIYRAAAARPTDERDEAGRWLNRLLADIGGPTGRALLASNGCL